MKSSKNRLKLSQLEIPSYLLPVLAGLIALCQTLQRGIVVQKDWDSQMYLDLSSKLTTIEAFTSIRTLGYPLFLNIVQLSMGSVTYLPLIQLLIFFMACIVLSKGLYSSGLSKWDSNFLSSGVFLFSFWANREYQYLLTDFLATSLNVMSVGLFLLMRAFPRRSRIKWIFVLSVTFCYHIRPAYLFLLAYFPLLIFFLSPEKSRVKLRQSTTLFLSLLAPFVGYGLLRLGLVGHFGLVSFGGTNVIGIFGQLLTPAHLTHLSKDIQPLAQALIEGRESIPDLAGQVKTWETPYLGRFNVSQERLAHRFNYMAWSVAHQIAFKMYDGDNLKINQAFSTLSQQVFLTNPLAFVIYYGKSWLNCISQVLSMPRFLMTLLLLFAGVGILSLQAKSQISMHFKASSFRLIFWTTCLSFLLKGAMLLVAQPPIPRYLDAMTVFFPLLLGLGALEIGREIYRQFFQESKESEVSAPDPMPPRV